MGVVVASIASVSCDKLLLTQNFDAPPEKDADKRPDAIDCVTFPGGQPDEDADGRNDFCDNCPTVSNPDQVDGDGDMVGLACDPAPNNAGDRIAYFGSMLTMEGLDLDPTVTLASGVATLKTGKVRVSNPAKPTFVVAEVSMRTFAGGDKVTVEVAEGANEWSCNIGFALPACSGSDCIVAHTPDMPALQGLSFDEPAMTARVVLETRGNGFTACTGVRVNGTKQDHFATNNPDNDAQGTVAVKSQGEVELRNVIVYDRP
jgi:hypothetical protein